MSQSSRKQKLINPRLQLRLVGAGFLMTALALGLQFLLLSYFVTTQATELDGGGGELAMQLPSMLLLVLTLTLAIILPIVFVLGIKMTFRFAGPLYRLEKDLKAYARGERQGPLRIRENDEFQSLCDAINGALETRYDANSNDTKSAA